MVASLLKGWPCRVMIALGVAFTASADEPTGTVSNEEVAEASSSSDWVQPLVKRCQDSVVVITVEGRDGQQVGMGTGFVVSPNGLIATNLHVIGEARPIQIRFRDGQKFPVVEVHASDRHLDLAVVRIVAQDLTSLKLIDSTDEVLPGRPFIALGNPRGLRHSVVQGVVSGAREIDGKSMLQVAMPIESGNSGGPLVDVEGRVMGVVTMKAAMTANLGFAVPAAALRTLLQQPNPVAMAKWQTIGSLDPKRWATRYGARWKQQAGAIVVAEAGTGFGGRAICLQQQAAPDRPFEVGAFVKLDDESGAAGLIFNFDEQDRHYGFYPSGGRLRLTRFDGPTVYSWHILEEIDTPHYHPGEWNHLKVRLEGDQLKCYVNDQLIVDRTDVNPPNEGRVGLAKFRDTHAQFRSFQLSDRIGATRPTSEQVRPLIAKVTDLSWGDTDSHALLDEFATQPKLSRFAIERRAKELREEAQRLSQLANDVHVRHVCQQLEQLFQQEAQQKSVVGRGALLISSLDNTELDVDACLQQLQRMADEISEVLPATDASDEQRQAKLNEYLFQKNGFHGSRTNYYHAANSYFDRLLEDREGLPITISILYMELGQRLGLKIDGVGLPGHFIVQFTPRDAEPQLIDVFDQAKPMSRDVAQRRAIEATGRFDEGHLAVSTPREILTRMLRNLQGIAQTNRDSEPLLRYLEAMVTLQPEDVSIRGMRAVVRHETGRTQAALEDLDAILAAEPPGIDLQPIRELRHRFSQ